MISGVRELKHKISQYVLSYGTNTDMTKYYARFKEKVQSTGKKCHHSVLLLAWLPQCHPKFWHWQNDVWHSRCYFDNATNLIAFWELSFNIMLWSQIKTTETHLPIFHDPKSKCSRLHLVCKEMMHWTFQGYKQLMLLQPSSRQGRKNIAISTIWKSR